MSDIYNKLEIPEPSDDLASRIILAANMQEKASQKKHFFPRLAVIAACLLISVIILQPSESYEVASSGYLNEIELFDEQYGFYEEIEFANSQEDLELEMDFDIEFFDEHYGFVDEIS